MTEYAVENYADLIEELKPLLPLHAEELNHYPDIPLDVDYEYYAQASALGLLTWFTARKDGELIGYAVYLVRRNPHYAHRWAISDVVFIHPDHRNAGVGNGFFDFIEAWLVKDGEPTVIHTGTKIAHPALAILLRSRGHDTVDLSFTKRLG